MKNLSMFMGKIRPQIFLALCILGIVAVLGMSHGLNEVTVGCIAGVIALAKDVLQSDGGDNGNGNGNGSV